MAKSAIVIGSGFGGAVSACRLAQAGFGVTVIERGRRYDGEARFPRKLLEMLWEPSRGPYDLRAISEIQLALGAGYGGGSLIYSNVHLRMPADAFQGRGWPAGYTREALDPYYDLVAYMLDLKPITADAGGPPLKARRMEAAATALHREQQLFYPPLAIDFSPDPAPHDNKFGVRQSACVRCGECVIGCNYRAKNTLDLNYLAVAEQRGAKMLTEREVFRVEPRPGGAPGDRVGHRAPDGGDERFDEADLVFVCAGAMGSTELLLRCRAAGALPDVGAQLGTRFSGNGDSFVFTFDAPEPSEPSQGPTITTSLLFDDKKAEGRTWFLVQEGGYPRELWPLVTLAQGTVWSSVRHLPPLPPKKLGLHLTLDAPVAQLAPGATSVYEAEHDTPTFPSEIAGAYRQAVDPAPRPEDEPPAMVGSGLFLAMGRDMANGSVALDGDRVSLRWDVPSNLPLYNMESRLMRDLVGQLGAHYAEDPFWRYARIPITLHSLGGCPMGTSDADGVVDALGEVFHYPGLFVLDGAILPSSTGVNPSQTIAAVAERNIEQIIRRETGDAGWTAPDRARVTHGDDPLDHVVVPPTGTPAPSTPAVGVAFDEHMTGTWTPAPGLQPRTADCSLRITVPDVTVFLEDPRHMGIVEGTVELDGLTDGPARVVGGVWNLFVACDDGPDREMRYALPFHGKDGRLYGLYGVKLFVPGAGLAVLDETTTLEFHVFDGADRRSPWCGTGTVSIGLPGVIKLGGSIQVIGADGMVDRVRAEADFVSYFVDTLAKLAAGEPTPG